MKILHCIRSVDPVSGGPIEGVRQLAAAGHEFGMVHGVLSLDAPDAACVKECPLATTAVGTNSIGYGYSSLFVPTLRSLAPNYDIVVVNGLWQYQALGTLRALGPGPMPYVVFTHGMLDPWFKRAHPLKHLKKWLYWPWADYRVLRHARAVLFTCEEERLLARESFGLYRCREAVVRYGTAGSEGDPEALRKRFLQQYPEASGRRVLLFLGRLHPKKGPEMLLRAMATLRAELPRSIAESLHLVMAGGGPEDYLAQLRRLSDRLDLRDAVTWTGHLRGEDKWGAFHASEMFILPSHQENFGLAVAEALSASLPVLLGHGVNIWPQIVGDGAGISCMDTEEGTLRLLRCWLELGVDELAEMRRRAKTCFLRRFHNRDAALSLHSVLSSVLDEHRDRRK